MAAADQIPSALAITSTAIPTRSDHDGSGTATRQRSSSQRIPSGATTRKEPQKTTICRAVAVTCREVGALASAGRAANGPISAHRVGSRPRSSRAQATRDPRAAAAMMTTPIPASVVKVAYAASATATRSVHAEATTAAHRIPAAASADPTTNSGTSSSARGSGSSEPSVATRTAGTRGTAIHHAAPPSACAANQRRAHVRADVRRDARLTARPRAPAATPRRSARRRSRRPPTTRHRGPR